jgi:hypothetical protein
MRFAAPFHKRIDGFVWRIDSRFGHGRRNPEPITQSFVPRNAMNRVAGLGRISEAAVRTCRHLPGGPSQYATEPIRHGFDATQSRRQTTVFCAISSERNRP